ncbi:hypothetical protein NQZ68_007974 [Dissostichus eleginoides]|nr:hypothetical protein NQZ68_007974 [Dissostichus eleginoides]
MALQHTCRRSKIKLSFKERKCVHDVCVKQNPEDPAAAASTETACTAVGRSQCVGYPQLKKGLCRVVAAHCSKDLSHYSQLHRGTRAPENRL